MRRTIIIFGILIILFGVAGHAQAIFHGTNSYLDIYVGENYSYEWNLNFTTSEYSEVCWREEYSLWYDNEIHTSDGFTVEKSFDDSSIAYLRSGDFLIMRTVEFTDEDERYFIIKYEVVNEGLRTYSDVRFFQQVDYDVPCTCGGEFVNDKGWYDSAHDAVWVRDDGYAIQHGFTASVKSSAHGTDSFYAELSDDLDGSLNGNDYYYGDPAVGMQYNMGDMTPGRIWTIKFWFYFGEPTGCIDKDGDGQFAKGWFFCTTGADCDDYDATVKSGAKEICDGQINNCYNRGKGLVENDLLDLTEYFAVMEGGSFTRGATGPTIYLTLQPRLPNHDFNWDLSVNGNPVASNTTTLHPGGIYWNALDANGQYLLEPWSYNSAEVKVRCQAQGASGYTEQTHSAPFTIIAGPGATPGESNCGILKTLNGIVSFVIPPEKCDGVDNDCDGEVDENKVCCEEAEVIIWPYSTLVPNLRYINLGPQSTYVTLSLPAPAPDGGCEYNVRVNSSYSGSGHLHDHVNNSNYSNNISLSGTLNNKRSVDLIINEGNYTSETLKYKSGELAGVDKIEFKTKEGSSYQSGDSINVRYSALVGLIGNEAYTLKCTKYYNSAKDVCDPNTYGHESFYNVSPDVKNKFEAIAIEYRKAFNTPPPLLVVNDASLRWGGLYDVNKNWKTPHRTHRMGTDIDVRTKEDLPKSKFDRFENIVCKYYGYPYLEDEGTTNEHYHLYFYAYGVDMSKYNKLCANPTQ